jgi:hypothetical protein
MFKQLQKLGLALLVGAFSISNVNSQVIFSEDFNGANALSNWTLIDNDGLTPQPGYSFFTDAWIIMTDADSTGMMDSVAASTSWYQPSGQADDYLISPQINLTSNNVLQFDAQASDANFPDGYEVLISTTTPTIAGFQANQPLLTVPAENPSWTRRNIDLSAYSGNVYLAIRNNSNNMNILFIDNFLVETLPTFDAEMLLGFLGEYRQIPMDYADSLRFIGAAKNIGVDTLDNVRFRYNVFRNGASVLLDSTITQPTLLPGDTAVLGNPMGYQLTQMGNYNIEYEVVFNGTDANVSNNTIVTDTLRVTDSTFARDNGTFTGSLGIGGGNTGELGLSYFIPNSDTITSVSLLIANGSGGMTGQPLSVNIRDFNGVPGNVIASSDTITYTATGASFVTLTFNNNGGYVPLPADTFFVGVVERDSNVSIGTTPNAFTPQTGWVNFPTSPFGGWAPNEAFNFNVTYILRPNFGDPGVLTGIESNEAVISDFNIYPNPSNGLVQVSMVNEEANNDLQVRVLDISGKTVFEDTYVAGQLFNEQLDLSSLEGGVYFIQLNNGEVQRTEKLILK